MARRLNASDKDFAADFGALLSAKREMEEDVTRDVKRIIAEVRQGGDNVLVELSNRFDSAGLTAADLKIPIAEIEGAIAEVPAAQKKAIDIAAARIEAYHRRQLPQSEDFRDRAGARLGWRWTPVDCAGLYVPGGTASYPSSVLMNAIPARVAGVRRIAMVTPASGSVFSNINAAVISLASGSTRNWPMTPCKRALNAASKCVPGACAVALPRSRLPSIATWPGDASPRTQSPRACSSAVTSSSWNNSHHTEGAGTRSRSMPMARSVSRLSRRPQRTMPN